jgi:hypothetical protein
VDPGATDACMGENMKFEMVIDWVAVAALEPLEESDADEPDPPPLLQAVRSSAAPRTRTTAPPQNRRTDSRILRPPATSG